MDIDNTRIADPVLAQEVADFTHNCYGPARARLFMDRPDLTEEQMHDVTWIGSRFFVDALLRHLSLQVPPRGLALRQQSRCRPGRGAQRRRLSNLPAVVVGRQWAALAATAEQVDLLLDACWWGGPASRVGIRWMTL